LKKSTLQNKIINGFRHFFWRHPARLLAIKATLVMAMLAIPLEIAGFSFFAVSLSLGVLAGALSEADDHPRGRVRALVLKVILLNSKNDLLQGN